MGKNFAILPAAAMLAACNAAPSALAQETPARTITVTGVGETAAAPDMAILRLGVQNEAPTAAAALRQNSSAMAATIETLIDAGVAEKDIQTSGLSVNPRYDYKRDGSKPEVTGFTASNNVSVKLRDLDNAGAIVDKAVQSGANTMGGISFTFANPKPLYEIARKNAVADARAKAELLTDAAGVDLGLVMTINEGYAIAPQPQPRMMRMEAAAADQSVPLQAGESMLSANVTIVYEIR